MNDLLFSELAGTYRMLGNSLRLAAYDPGLPEGADFSKEWLVDTHLPQERSFMVDMIPFVMECLYETSGGAKILDAGCSFGSGTELLGQLLVSLAYHRKAEFQLDGCDIQESCGRYHLAFNPHVRFLVSDIMNLADKSYDLVICSNVLEHFVDPMPWLEKLRRVATRYVIVLVPFNEPLGHYAPHLFCWSEAVINALQPTRCCYQTPINKQACFVLRATP